jgi:hypothetical protein
MGRKGENVFAVEDWGGFFVDLTTSLENRDIKRMRLFQDSEAMAAGQEFPAAGGIGEESMAVE